MEQQLPAVAASEQSLDAPHLQSLYEANPADVARLGGKAANLAHMIQNGIPVPEGYVLTTDAFDAADTSGQLPDTMLDDVMRVVEELGGEVAIRSSANVEDGEQSSMAGVFETNYAVNADRQTIGDLIAKAYNQVGSAEVRAAADLYGAAHEDIKLGLVIQRLVHPTCAGVVYASERSDQLVVQYVDDYGEKLVDGQTSGSTVLVDRESGTIAESRNFDNNPMPQQVAAELSEQTDRIAELFDNPEQDIEFAVDANGQLFIVQARPLTRELTSGSLEPTPYDMVQMTRERAIRVIAAEMRELGTDKAVLHLGNFAELLPSPTPMDVGTFQYIFSGFNGREGAIQLGRRQMGYPIGTASVGYLQYVGGRAYESLARDAGTYYSGFPETEGQYFDTLVHEYLDEVYGDPSRASYPEMGLYLQDPTFEDLAVRYGEKQAGAYMQTYQAFREGIAAKADAYLADFLEVRNAQIDGFIAAKRAEQLGEATDDELLGSYYEILEHLRQESCVDFVTAARLGFYYMQRLRSSLAEHPAVAENQVDQTLSVLSQGLESSSVTQTNIAISEAATDDEALAIARERIYHYPATGEILEIRHPRMTDEQLREYVVGLRSGDDYAQKFSHQHNERLELQNRLLAALPQEQRDQLATVMHNAQTYMGLRETVKDQFTREYALLRERLVEVEQRAGLRQGDMFYLYPDEVFQLAQYPGSNQHLIGARQREFGLYQELRMPPLLCHDTVHEIAQKVGDGEEFTETTGQFIAPGEAVAGVVVNMDEYDLAQDGPRLMALLDEHRVNGTPVILVAGQVNLTHDPFINKAHGLVLERAGFVSHGAQRARELGVGALSGIESARLRTGMQVHFDPANKSVRRIMEEA